MSDAALSPQNNPIASPEEQAALYELLAREAGRYLMGDSSSLPVETAAALFESIRFCLHIHGKTAPNDHGSLDERFEAGRREVWRLAEDTKGLLALAEKTAIAAESRSYRDTLGELAAFFRRYDYRFFAQEIPCMLDYQLALPVPEELRGIEFIREYLTRLVIENRVAGAFDPLLVKRLLTACYADYGGLLVNLFEPVYLSALGRSVLGRAAFRLSISDAERELLFERFRPWDESAARGLLHSAVTRLAGSLLITDALSLRYLDRCAEDFLPRLRVTSPEGWRRLFPSL